MLYSLAVMMAEWYIICDLKKTDIAILESAISDYKKSESRITREDAFAMLTTEIENVQKRHAEINKAEAKKFFSETKNKPDFKQIEGTEIFYKLTSRPPLNKETEDTKISTIKSTANITLKLLDGTIIYRDRLVELEGFAYKIDESIPKGLMKCLNTLRANQSYVFYIPPAEAFANEAYILNESFQRSVPPMSAIICELQVVDIKHQRYSDPTDGMGGSSIGFSSEMPEYPAGEIQMLKDIKKNLNLANKTKFNDAKGKAMVEFTVEKDGSVTNARIVRGLPGGTPEMDEAAVAAVAKLKKFKPAMQNGNPTRLTMTVPVHFE